MSGAGYGARRIHAYALTVVTTAIVFVFSLAEWATVRFVAARWAAAGTAIEIGIVLIAALVFRPFHQKTEAAVEAIFHRRRRQALAALHDFRRELTSFNDVDQLLRRVIEAVDRFLDVRATAIYLRRDVFHAEASSFDEAAVDVSLDDPLAIRLRSSGVPARPASLGSPAPGTHAFPMMAAGGLVGFVLVRCELGDQDIDEIGMLSGLAQDLAVALVALDPRLRERKAEIPNNIPVDLPAVIGRERELGEIKAILARSRLVTLTGPGGVGKTRIALQCAADAIREHEHGAWFIGLETIAQGKLVAATVLAELGAGATEPGDPVDRLLDFLRPRDALLVIDNCEQVVADVASVVRRIRASCPRITLLATSREMLHLDGEQVYTLASLRPEAAVELFAARAAAVSPGFDVRDGGEAVRRICERLDGIPLAIELAAARVKMLSVEEILQRLSERFRLLASPDRTSLPRQHTLAALIRWSYDLLAQEEQSLFRALSVFRGSFSLAAAAAICSQDGQCDDYHVLDVLTSLVDKSLLTVKTALTTRYRYLETIRDFADARAVEKDERAPAADRHAAHFATVATHAYHEFDSRLPTGWLERLAPDLDNFRAALEWTLDGPGDRRAGAQLAADCGPIYLRLGLLAEGLHWCETARHMDGVPPSAAARIEYVCSMLQNNLRDYKAALESADRAVLLYRRSPDERGLIRALSQTAHQYARAHRFADARGPAAEAIERARALGEPRVLASVLRRCAMSLPPEEIESARELFAEALATAERIHEPEEGGYVLQWWGISEAAAGRFDRAMELAHKALERADTDTQMYLESDVAGYALASGAVAEAEAHARRGLTLAVGGRHPVLSALAIAYCAPQFATSDSAQGARLFGFASARLKELQFEGDPAEIQALQNAARSIEDSLHGEAIAPLLDEGMVLTQEEALEILAPRSALGSAERADFGPGDRVVARLR
jgi:predicted ATPase